MKIPFDWLFRIKAVKRGILALGVYLAVYAVLSLFGSRQGNVSSLARLGIIIKGISDRSEWQPRFIIVTHFPHQDSPMRANLPGYFFLPLVFVDQHLCHSTKPIIHGKVAATDNVFRNSSF